MGKSALDNLRDASELRRIARDLSKSDKQASDAIKSVAHSKTMRAVKQLKTRPKRKGASIIGGGIRIL